jgi:hypothetical protein
MVRAISIFSKVRPEGNNSQKQKQGRLGPVVLFEGFQQRQAEKEDENRDARTIVRFFQIRLQMTFYRFDHAVSTPEGERDRRDR